MTASLDDQTWDTLIERIREKRCTPFLGAGVSTQPLAAEIAQKWATEYGYPLADSADLARVTQFVAVTLGDSMVPKERLLELFRNTDAPDFNDLTDPHGLLADLPFELYITTNYDDFLVRALRNRNRTPQRVVCCWNSSIEGTSPEPPSSANPWVFHLHGSDDDPQSIVLTEDDYVDFLVRLRDRDVLPHYIEKALNNTQLLFMGYSLTDWTFRVLYRGVVLSRPNSQQRTHVAVQLPREDAAAEEYLNKYFGDMKVRVFWGTAEAFVSELRRRWEARRDRTGVP